MGYREDKKKHIGADDARENERLAYELCELAIDSHRFNRKYDAWRMKKRERKGKNIFFFSKHQKAITQNRGTCVRRLCALVFFLLLPFAILYFHFDTYALDFHNNHSQHHK